VRKRLEQSTMSS